MNTHSFSHLMTAALAPLTLLFHEQPSLPLKPTPPMTAEAGPFTDPLGPGWDAQSNAFSDDEATFRSRSLRRIEDYAVATESMRQRCGESRSYLRTRLRALDEHVEYARAELVNLPSSQSDDEFIHAHANFHRTMNGLDKAFTQALNELNDGV